MHNTSRSNKPWSYGSEGDKGAQRIKAEGEKEQGVTQAVAAVHDGRIDLQRPLCGAVRVTGNEVQEADQTKRDGQEQPRADAAWRRVIFRFLQQANTVRTGHTTATHA